jgi:Uma2 family endonuclease
MMQTTIPMEVTGEMPAPPRASLDPVPTLVRDPQPADFEALLVRRRRLGLDRSDEVWEGVLHMNPAPHGRHAEVQWQLAVLLDQPARAGGLRPVGEFNLGEPEDYRVPDGGLHAPGEPQLFYPTAKLVVEVVSPDDETWAKLGFYAAHGVDELLIVDPQERRVHWLALAPGGEYQPLERSSLIALAPAELAERIDWPD